MGHSKQFHGKKQRNNNKASRSRKARQRTEKNRAAGASSISEENMNSDDHDLETVAAFRVSIAADACTNPKRKDDYYSKSWNTKDDEVYIAKTDIHTGFDDQTTTDSGYAEVLKRWSAGGDGVYIADDETLNGFDDRTPQTVKACDSVDLKTMAALGVSVVHTHKFPRYYCYPGPVDRDDVLKRWSTRGDGVYIADDETLNGLPFLDRAEVSKSRSTHSDGVYIAENLDAC